MHQKEKIFQHSDAVSDRVWARAVSGGWLYLCVGGIGLLGYLLPALGYFTMIPGDLGDARFNSVVLEHGYQWLNGQVGQFWSPSFFYPFERMLGLSDSHLGSGWVYGGLRFFGLSREMAYSGWYLAGFVLNFLACGVVLHQAKFSPLAAALGSFAFTFALPVLHQEGHAQLGYRFAIPVACFFWYQALAKRDWISAVQSIFWCSVQFMCSVYLGVFLVYCLLAIVLAFSSVRVLDGLRVQKNADSASLEIASHSFNHHNHFYNWRRWFWCATATIGVALVFLLLRQYKNIATDYQFFRSLDDLRPLIPRPSSYLLGDNSELTRWLGSGIATFATRSEHQMFIGLGIFCVAAMGAWATELARVFFATLLILIGLTLMVADQSLYLWLLKIPGFDAIRAVSRIILVMLFPVAVLVATGVDRLLWLKTLKRSMLRPLLTVGIVFVVTLESVYYVPHHSAVQTWLDRQRGLVSLIKMDLPKDAILFVTQRKDEPFYITELDAMIYAQDHYLTTLNGYSGNSPPGYAPPDPCLPGDARLLGYFTFRGVSEIKQREFLSRLRVVALEGCAN